jgi:hypothetical protein
VVCGQCGYHMMVLYKATPRYLCSSHALHTHGKPCQSVSAPSIDAVVTQAFFEALQPAQLNILADVLSAQKADQAALDQQWQERRQRADYETQLAERRYRAVDPENRLVASTLEQQWEQALRQVHEVQEAYQRHIARQALPELTPTMRTQFEHLSQTLPELWNLDQITSAQKKELLRSLVSKVILTRLAADQVEVKVVWISGHYTVKVARPRIPCERAMANYTQFVRRIGELCAQGFSDSQIAVHMTREGFHTAQRDDVNAEAVRNVRMQYGFHLQRHCKRTASQIDGYWTTRGLAIQLGVKPEQISRRIRKGVIDPHSVCYDEAAEIYLIQDYPTLIESLRQSFSPARGTRA